MIIRNNIKRIMILLVVICLLYVVWEFYIDDFKVWNEQFVYARSDGYFIANSEQIEGLSICLEDLDSVCLGPAKEIPIKILISDSDGNVLMDYVIDEMRLVPYEFCTTQELKNLFVEVNEGQKYKIDIYSDIEQVQNITIALKTTEGSLKKVYVCCSLLTLLLLTGILWNEQIHVCWQVKVAAVLFVIGLLYIIAYGEMTVPDSRIHFAQAYGNSNSLLGLNKYNEQYRILMTDDGLLRLSEYRSDGAQGLYRFWNNCDYGNNHDIQTSANYMYQFHLKNYVYTPSMIGVTIARIFRAPYQIVYLSGCITNLLFFIGVIILTMTVCPSVKKSVFAICLLPSVIWLAGSYSYDVWVLSFSIFYISYCISLRDRKVKWSDILFLAVIIAVMAPVKVVYVIVAFAILIIPLNNFTRLQKICMYVGVPIVGVLLTAIGRGREALKYLLTSSQDGRSVVEGHQSFTLDFVIHNPVKTTKVFINNFFVSFERYIYKGVAGDYLFTEISYFLIFLILILVLLIFANDLKEKNISIKTRIVSFGIFVLGCFSVCIAFLFTYSVVENESIGTISGVQGRYFLPFVMLSPVFFKEKFINIENKTNDILRCLCALNIASVFFNFVGIMR